MKRRNFLAALAAVVVAGPKTEKLEPEVSPSPVILNGHLLQWSEEKNRHELVARTWELGERTFIEHAGWCVCITKGTDETARWHRCDAPVGIYNISAV